MNQEQYITGCVDMAINYHQDLPSDIKLSYTITQTSVIQYKIEFEWLVGYDNHTEEYVTDEAFVIWNCGKVIQSMDHIFNLLDELEKVNYDEDYDSRIDKLEAEGQSQLDSLRNK
jgi:hypothetical protein